MQRISHIRSKSNGVGFTLIELLVVIAVIAILIGLVAPVVSSSREKVRSIKCASNLRDIGIAFTHYAADNDQWFPPVCNISAGWQIWPYFLTPYAGDARLAGFGPHRPGFTPQQDVWDTMFICPSFNREFPGRALSQKILGGYGMNRRLPPHETKDEDPANPIFGNDWVTQYQSRGKKSAISDPSKRILVACGSGSNGDLETYWQAQNPGSSSISKKRHNDGANIVYVDGHVAAMTAADMMARATNESRKIQPMLFRSGNP